MKYHILTYGCQMNQSDSERISATLEKSGYKQASKEEANLIVINMCSVRQSAVDRIHGLVPKFKKPVKTILTGCILKKDQKQFSEKFDYVLDIKNLSKWPMISAPKNYLEIQPKYSNDFSVTIPIMTGCNNFCSYCVVPYTRGREISKPVKEIICEIKNLIKKDYKEIWLLGQNVNSYKDNKTDFPKLLKMVNDIPGNFWIRFTSSHPKDFSDKLIKVMSECDKITNYLNLPIQSGDDKILKSMNRHYTVKDYTNIINKLRKAIPGITLTTDAIVGFPKETKKQFENTAELFRNIKYDMAYISKYSPRHGSVASKLKDNISPQEKSRRDKVLTEILKQTALENNKKYVGQKVEALMEKKKNDYWIGKTKDYKTVQIKSDKDLTGKFVKIEITDAQAWALKGK